MTISIILSVSIEEFCTELTRSCPVTERDYQGSFSVLEDAHEHLSEYEPGDVAIYYDYMDDGLSYADCDKLRDWLYDVAWPLMREYMADNGYEATEDNDGSGNGMYYGYEAFRKS